MCSHKEMHSFNLSSLFTNIQGVTSIQICHKGLINDYSQKMIFSISHLQDNSSDVVCQIFSVTQGVCTHQIPLQYMIHHLSSQDVANLLRAIQ